MNTQPTPALTHEELKQHADFVYRCVMDNTVLDAAGRAGLTLRMTVQEIVHSNVATLRKIGGQIEEIANKAGSSRFSTTGPHKISGVESSKWIDFLALQIKLKQVEEAEVDKAKKVERLGSTIGALYLIACLIGFIITWVIMFILLHIYLLFFDSYDADVTFSFFISFFYISTYIIFKKIK